MHRFFIPQSQISDHQVTIDSGIAHQLHSVLRMKPDDKIIVLDNLGWEYSVKLTSVSKKVVSGEILGKTESQGEPQTHIILYQCLLKKGNFELVLQKCTEVGVSEFVPVISERTVSTPSEKSQLNKLDRWERIVTEAAEQSRRGRIPQVHPPLSFDAALEHAGAADVAVIPWEDEDTVTFSQMLTQKNGKNLMQVALFIGAEGGFSPSEVQRAIAKSVFPITLGQRILRAETAAIVASALLLHELG